MKDDQKITFDYVTEFIRNNKVVRKRDILLYLREIGRPSQQSVLVRAVNSLCPNAYSITCDPTFDLGELFEERADLMCGMAVLGFVGKGEWLLKAENEDDVAYMRLALPCNADIKKLGPLTSNYGSCTVGSPSLGDRSSAPQDVSHE